MPLYMCQVLHVVDFLGSRRMETALTSIEVLLRPTQSQSDEPSNLRGSLSPTSVYWHLAVPGGHPSNYEPGATLLNFSDRAQTVERTPYFVYKFIYHCTYQGKTIGRGSPPPHSGQRVRLDDLNRRKTVGKR